MKSRTLMSLAVAFYSSLACADHGVDIGSKGKEVIALPVSDPNKVEGEWRYVDDNRQMTTQYDVLIKTKPRMQSSAQAALAAATLPCSAAVKIYQMDTTITVISYRLTAVRHADHAGTTFQRWQGNCDIRTMNK